MATLMGPPPPRLPPPRKPPPPTLTKTKVMFGEFELDMPDPSLAATFGTSASSPAPPAPPGPTIMEILGAEAWRRVDQGRMWRWQSSLFVWRAINPSRATWEKDIHSPARWPEGRYVPVWVDPMWAKANTPLWMGCDSRPGTEFTWKGGHFEVPCSGRAGTNFSVPIRCVASCGTVYTTHASRPVSLVATPREVFTPDATTGTGELVATLLAPRLLTRSDGSIGLMVDERNSDPTWKSTHLGMGCRIEITLDGQLAGTSAFSPKWKEEEILFRRQIPVNWKPGMEAQVRQDPTRARILLTADPDRSFESYTKWPFEDSTPKCWTGTLELPARVVTLEAEKATYHFSSEQAR